MPDRNDVADTSSEAYTERLGRLEGAAWKRWLDVQAPYRWNIRRLNLGHTLDIGCGIGRNLLHLEGMGVGVDHNGSSVETCRRRGLRAYRTEEFMSSDAAAPETFDSLLIAHVLEHVNEQQALDLLRSYLPFLKPLGRLVLITPQELGYARDASHVCFVGFAELKRLVAKLGLSVERHYSFPLPRAFGRIFQHNEFVLVARNPSGVSPGATVHT